MTLQHLRTQCLEIFLLRCLLSFWNVNLGGKTRRIFFIFFYMYVCIQIKVRRTLKGHQGWSLCSWALGISKCWLYDLYHALNSHIWILLYILSILYVYHMYIHLVPVQDVPWSTFFSFLNHWYFIILTRVYSYISSTVICEDWFPGENIK